MCIRVLLIIVLMYLYTNYAYSSEYFFPLCIILLHGHVSRVIRVYRKLVCLWRYTTCISYSAFSHFSLSYIYMCTSLSILRCWVLTPSVDQWPWSISEPCKDDYIQVYMCCMGVEIKKAFYSWHYLWVRHACIAKCLKLSMITIHCSLDEVLRACAELNDSGQQMPQFERRRKQGWVTKEPCMGHLIPVVTKIPVTTQISHAHILDFHLIKEVDLSKIWHACMLCLFISHSVYWIIHMPLTLHVYMDHCNVISEFMLSTLTYNTCRWYDSIYAWIACSARALVYAKYTLIHIFQRVSIGPGGESPMHAIICVSTCTNRWEM